MVAFATPQHQPPWGSESVRGWNEQASWSVTCHRPSLPGRGSRCQQGGRCGACVVVVIKQRFGGFGLSRRFGLCQHSSVPFPDLSKENDGPAAGFLQIPLSSVKAHVKVHNGVSFYLWLLLLLSIQWPYYLHPESRQGQ